jgi:hypothetical protein
MRAYLIALGLTTLIIGLPLTLAGYEHVGCTVTDSGGDTNYSNCGGAADLEWGGIVLIVAAVIFFAASFVPNEQSRYK